MTETKHTALPWTASRALRPVDDEFDYAIGAEIDGKTRCIAEVFGRVAEDIRSDAQANAAFIIRACNAHEALVAACQEVLRCAALPDEWAAPIRAAIAKAQA